MNENLSNKMGKAKIYTAAALATLGSMFLSMDVQAKSHDKTPQGTESKIDVTKNPFKMEYKSDSSFYRAVKSGESSDMSTAKKMAIFNANHEISNQSGAVVSDSKIIEEKCLGTTDASGNITSYTYWVAVEVAK